MKLGKELIKSTIKKELSWDLSLFEKELEKLERLSWTKYQMVDAHVHIVDFNQETAWLKNMLHYMDAWNIVSAVIFGMSVIKIWDENERERPGYYLDDDNACYQFGSTDMIVAHEYLSLNKEERKRFFPLLSWFNALDINCVRHIEQTFKAFPWVFNWIWEVFFRHDDLTHLTYWEVPRMNTRATRKLLEFVTKYDLPLCIHNNITAPWVSDYPKFLYEMEEALREYPKARVILSHAWASRRLRSPYYTKMMERLLIEYPGLYIDYSWVIFDEIIAINDTSMQEWLSLTEKFPDRIMIWSDVLGNAFHEIWFVNSRFNSFLDKLTPETRQKVCIDNALNVYSKTKNRVEKWKSRVYPKLSDVKI
jgi:hypothetical protein